ncbi:MAG TPA: molybdopterin-dependent oxidoreductase [Terriglobia bacterium]|nr:molybdopterin-dependent oxidoreductase [Terriglobia bacterium]
MSEDQRKPEGAGGAGEPPLGESPIAQGRTEAAPASPVAAAVTANGSTVEAATTPPGAPEITTPDPRELEAWNEQVRRRMAQRSRRSFLGLGAGFLAGFGAWRWLVTRRDIDGDPWPFRQVLQVNEQLARDYFSSRRLAPEFKPSQVSPDRVNGDVGLDDDVDVSTWRMSVEGLGASDGPLMLGLDAVKQLPRVEMTTEFKCIEGWSVIVQWAGARFKDFMKAYPPATLSGADFSFDRPLDIPPYVSMSTPDSGYYVGLEMESMLHPQTLLCYERNGAPLTQEHGAPLRLVIPVKYGVKNIKRIGSIRYTTLRPADYWAERGYDWYIGL